MDDKQIVDLYFERNEAAIKETEQKYGKYCYAIAYNILQDRGDSEECVNDTYLNAWNARPPQRPNRLATFLGRITRNLSLNRYAQKTAEKRGGHATELALDELAECIPSGEGDPTDELALREAINRFLRELPRVSRVVFLQRYWYFRPIKAIAADANMSENAVKVMLHRVRERFLHFLEKEGIAL